MWAAASRAPVRASGRNPPGSGRDPATVLESSSSRGAVGVSSMWASMGAKQGGGDAGGSDSLRASPESPRLSRPPTLCAAPRGGEDHADAPPLSALARSCRVHVAGHTYMESSGRTRNISTHFPNMAAWTVPAGSAPRKAQRRKFPEARVACGNELSDAHAGYPGAALHIRDQLHLVWGKFSEGQADHYILPAVPCPVIHAGGDLDDCKSRWQNRQTAMLARTRPGPAGARRTPGRALGRCGTIYTKPSYSPLDVALAASCILRLLP